MAMDTVESHQTNIHADVFVFDFVITSQQRNDIYSGFSESGWT